MKAARLLKERAIEVLIIPLPRDISPDCDLALDIQCDNIEEIKGFLKDQGCQIVEILPH
jgi:hypothetical protein